MVSDVFFFFFFSSRRRHTRSLCDWSSDVCSSDLFGHDPAKWDEFRRRYRAELLVPEHGAALDVLARRARHGTVTIVYGARDEQHNNAVVLAEVLQERLDSA